MKSTLQFKQFLLAILFVSFFSSLSFAQCTRLPAGTIFSPVERGDGTCTFEVELCITVEKDVDGVSFSNTITISTGSITNTIDVDGPFENGDRVCQSFSYIQLCTEAPTYEGAATADGTTGNNGNGSPCETDFFPPYEELVATPVELRSFTAQPSKAHVTLNWATASELNNDYFDIERSTDGRSFQKIERVKGAGTTDLTLHYSYKDVKPQRGQNYYRLKQVDFDDTFEYSDIITADFKGSDQVVKIIPTHSFGEFSVVFFDVFDENAPIEVFDLIGNRVLTGYLPTGGNEVHFDVSNLNSGQYYIRVRGADDYITERFLKVE